MEESDAENSSSGQPNKRKKRKADCVNEDEARKWGGYLWITESTKASI